MKFYIASKLGNAETVKRVAAVLKAAGHTHTYDWTEHGNVRSEGPERLSEVAENERRGVLDANIVIVIMPGGRGTHAELGMGAARGKKLIICAEDDALFQADANTCAFYWLYGVTRVVGTMDEWLRVILERARDYPYLEEACTGQDQNWYSKQEIAGASDEIAKAIGSDCLLEYPSDHALKTAIWALEKCAGREA